MNPVAGLAYVARLHPPQLVGAAGDGRIAWIIPRPQIFVDVLALEIDIQQPALGSAAFLAKTFDASAPLLDQKNREFRHKIFGFAALRALKRHMLLGIKSNGNGLYSLIGLTCEPPFNLSFIPAF